MSPRLNKQTANGVVNSLFPWGAVGSTTASARSGIHPEVTLHEHESLTRLFKLAAGRTGQGRRVADFLLAWWDAERCGGFNPATLWELEAKNAKDLLAVLQLIARCRHYPESLGYGPALEQVLQVWEPDAKNE